METFELVTLKSGITSLRSLINRETFHPVTGPAVEAQILHVDQQRLLSRAATVDRFVVWDVGLGAGANALAAVKAFIGTHTSVEIHSFDRTTAPLEFAIQHANELKYLLGHEKTLSSLLANGSVNLTPHLSWHFHLGDFGALLDTSDAPAPHSIIYDPYSSKSNSEMWTLEHFERLYSRLSGSHPCLLTNYTRSTAVRVSLLLAGFAVGVGCEVGEKAETTIASNSLTLLERPLDRKWLERVRISRNSAPLRSTQGQANVPSTINTEDFERLKELPQFRSFY